MSQGPRGTLKVIAPCRGQSIRLEVWYNALGDTLQNSQGGLKLFSLKALVSTLTWSLMYGCGGGWEVIHFNSSYNICGTFKLLSFSTSLDTLLRQYLNAAISPKLIEFIWVPFSSDRTLSFSKVWSMLLASTSLVDLLLELSLALQTTLKWPFLSQLLHFLSNAGQFCQVLV